MYWFMILVVHAIWQADLTAFLTKNNLELPISSLKDLAHNDKIVVLTMKGTSTYNMFQVRKNITKLFITIAYLIEISALTTD